MVDLDIEYHLDPRRYSNRSDSWRLPKRTALGHLFAETPGVARVVSGGLPSVEVNRHDQYVRLRVPSKRAILHGLLKPAYTGDPQAKQRFSDFRTSVQGQRLSGIIGLFETLEYAGRTFDDSYWRSVFLQLSGLAANQSQSQVNRVEEMLLAADVERGIAKPEERTALARRIVARLSYFSLPTASMTWNELQQRFTEVKRSDTEHTTIGAEEAFEDLKAREIADFVESGILVQGVSLRCVYCGKYEWLVTDSITSEVRCDGCLRTYPLLPNPTWRFRVNDLIRNGITKVGVLAVLHALFQKSQFARDLLLYLPCQVLYEEYGGDPYSDLDLFAIRDGQIIIGEVKSSVEGYRDADFGKLKTVAEVLRPDVLVLAATGSEWLPNFAGAIDALRTTLGPLITVETMLLPW